MSYTAWVSKICLDFFYYYQKERKNVNVVFLGAKKYLYIF